MEKYKKFAIKGICILICIAFIYLFLKIALGIVLPFAISLLIVAISRPIIQKICKSRKVPKKLATVLVVALIALAIIFITSLCVSLTLNELGNIASSLMQSLEGEDNFLSRAFLWIDGIRDKFPFLNNILPGVNESVYSLVLGMVMDGVKSLSATVTGAVAGFITGLPGFIIALTVIILSVYYLLKDYDIITRLIVKILPEKVGKSLPSIKNDVVDVTLKYIKSYLILLLLTFAILFSGFLILGIENSFVLALLISIVDMLPILGVGTVLLPWGVIELIGGNTLLGVGLLLIFIVAYVIRQIAEPRILSAQMDVHPLLTLIAMYAGLKLAGVAGLILAPFLTFVIKTVYVSFKKEKTVENQVKL